MDKDYIKFEDIKKLLEIPDISLFQIYLKEVYKDLADRAESNRKNGISKITFMEYFKLPVLIAEKLFSALDKDNDNFLSVKEFIEGLFKLFTGTFRETAEVVFDMLDFNKDGKISKGDVKILLSYLPLKNNDNIILYKDQMEGLHDIDSIIKDTFVHHDLLDFNEFLSVTQNKKSDIYVQLLCFIYDHRPFSEDNIKAYQNYRKKSSPEISYKPSPNSSPSEVKIPSPNRKSKLLPADSLLCLQPLDLDNPQNSPKKSPKRMSLRQYGSSFMRMANTKIPENTGKGENKIEDLLKSSKNIYNSPTKILKKESAKLTEFKLEDELVSMNIKDAEQYSSEDDDIRHENWVYKITETNKLKKYWLCLIGKDIYYYKTEKKDELQGMHNLSGCFVNENPEKNIEGKQFYSFSIIFSSKSRNYYSLDPQEIKTWIEIFRKAIGLQNFFDYYNLSDDIGEGKFGVVKLGIHKSTGEKVAIKIIKKTAMNITDMELVRSEIDIMKLCKHPNIVTLLDHFENSEYIFIAMEYLSGGDFGTYLKRQKYKFTEENAAKLMYQLASGIKYLHDYGVLHRDLKPENIMLSAPGDNPIIKIMDFGLSKILGPLEKVVDGYGTLSFVAPEVLIRQPYNKQIDIWSIGVIMYYMLSGILPFDDEDDNEEVIAKKTVFTELEFPDKYFKNRSDEVKDLITKCLIKDPNTRYSVENFLNHAWIKKHKK
jgi:glucan-binding YG repeat protein